MANETKKRESLPVQEVTFRYETLQEGEDQVLRLSVVAYGKVLHREEVGYWMWHAKKRLRRTLAYQVWQQYCSLNRDEDLTALQGRITGMVSNATQAVTSMELMKLGALERELAALRIEFERRGAAQANELGDGANGAEGVVE